MGETNNEQSMLKTTKTNAFGQVTRLRHEALLCNDNNIHLVKIKSDVYNEKI